MRFVASTTARVGRHGDVRPDLADLAVLDQHIRLREVADLPVEGQHHAALEQDAALSLHAGKLGIRRGWRPEPKPRGQHRRRSAAGGGSGAGREERAA